MSLLKVSTGLNGATSLQLLLTSTSSRFNVNLFGFYDIEVSSVEFSSTSSINTVIECQSGVITSSIGPTPYYRFATGPQVTSSGFPTSIGRKIWNAHGCILNGNIDINLVDVLNISGSAIFTTMQYCLITLNVTVSNISH